MYLCREPDLSMFSLKHSEYHYGKEVIREEGTMEVGQHCSEPTVPSPPNSLHHRRNGCANVKKTSVENLVYIVHQVNYKRKRSDSSLFFLLFLFCSDCLSQLWTIHVAGPAWDLWTGNIPCPLSFLSGFLPLLSGKCVYLILPHTELCCGRGRLWRDIVSC